VSTKLFTFTFEEERTHECASFVVEGETLESAFKLGVSTLPALFADKQRGLRMFRIGFENGRTKERAGALGQGETAAEAFGDVMKYARETFRPKNDGKYRPGNGVTVLVAARPGDTEALGRAVSRSVEAFQSDETYDQEQQRRRLEAHWKVVQDQGRAA
jgi:hypothetical protein